MACKEKTVCDATGDRRKAVSGSLNDFSLDLLNSLLEGNDDSNVLISPVSIMTALSMALLGARGNTEAEMVKSMRIDEWKLDEWHSAAGKFLQDMTLGRGSTPSPMNVANKMFVDKSYEILSSFKKDSKEYYDTEQGSVNFISDPKGSTKSINEWVKNKTKDKIPKLLSTLESMTRVVLVNAVHFKGNWKSKFKKENVKDKKFYVNSSKTMKVKMMYQKTKVPFSKSDDAIAIQMPFKEEGYSMHFILPTKRFGLKKLEENLLKNHKSLDNLLSNFFSPVVKIYIPKFKMRNNMDLIPQLRSLGMKDLFNGACDLSGVSGGKDLVVSSVVHEAFLDVNEDGAEAAGATAVVMNRMSVRGRTVKQRIRFRADEPFLVSINYCGSILFIGRITNPQPANPTFSGQADGYE